MVAFKPWRTHRFFLLCESRKKIDERVCAEFDLSFIITRYANSVNDRSSLGLDLMVWNEEDEIWQSPFCLKSGDLGCVPLYVDEIAGACFVKWFETPERLSKSFNC